MIISIFLFLFMLSNKIFNSILFQYHPDKTIDSDDETKILFGEILKMINNSYEIAIETHGTEQDLEDFTQSQSSEPSDNFSQQYGAGHNNEHLIHIHIIKLKNNIARLLMKGVREKKRQRRKFFFNVLIRINGKKMERNIKDKKKKKKS